MSQANDDSAPPASPGKKPRPPKRPRSRAWRAFFTTFKWCRITVLLTVFTVIILGLFLNHVGLPDWLERRIEEQFRAQGWELKFSRLRLRWYHGVVAENLQLQRTKTVDGPHLFVQSAEFALNWKALRHLDLEAGRALLNGGRLLWPLPGTNQPRRTLDLGAIGGELVFHKNDVWELKFIEAEVLGTHIRVRGDITNAARIRQWQLPQRPPEPAGDVRAPAEFWRNFLANAERVQFTGRPELNVIFNLDAARWRDAKATLKFTATAATSPWVSATNLNLSIDLLPPQQAADAIRIDLKATAQMARTPWASATNLDLKLVVEPSLTGLQPTNSLLLIDVNGAETPWGRAGHVFAEFRSNPSATNTVLRETRADIALDAFAGQQTTAARARVIATLVHPPENILPASAETTWTFHDLATPDATTRWARLATALNLPDAADFHLGRTNLSWPERLRNLPFDANVTLSNTTVARIELDRAELRTQWKFPTLRVGSAGQLETDSAAIEAVLDTATRGVSFDVEGTLDPMRFAAFFNTNRFAWGSELVLNAPPNASVHGRFTLPALVEREIDWRTEVLPTLQLAGHVEVSGGAIRRVPFTALRLPLTVTNLTWAIPDAVIRQSDGTLAITGGGSQARGDFRFHVSSDLNFLSLRPAVTLPRAGDYFDWFEWRQPPRIDASLHGNWTNLAALGFDGGVVFTNATFRGQSVHSATATFVYTNKLLSILSPLVLRKGEWGAADGIALDLNAEKLYLTNAVGKMAPRVITRAIGPRIDNVVAPYVFEGSPDAKTHGVFALKEGDNSHDVRFEVDGGPFHWQNFHLEKARAVLLWKGDTLTITNVTGRWLGARVAGSAFFDFDRTSPDNRFSFSAAVADGDLRKILRDLQPDRTNRTEGRVDGELHITSAFTGDWNSWQGHGHATMTDGLLWDIPLFGVFSPLLNTVLPGAGLGNSRAREAAMTYRITNSIIFTDDLEIRATAMRMNYQGTVDFQQRVKGEMEADLLRDFPAIGYVVSKLLLPITKLFKYEITGMLNDPKIRERYLIPRALMAPLHPIKTFKELFGADGDKKSGTPPAPKGPAE